MYDIYPTVLGSYSCID